MDRSWLALASSMTLLLTFFVVLFAPERASFGRTLGILPLWLALGGLIYLGVLSVKLVRLMLARHPAPMGALDLKGVPVAAYGFALAGMNMIAFMCAKPILNILVPFWADPLLSRVDSAFFLGKRPGDLLAFLNTDAMAYFYHTGWFILMIGALIHLLLRPPSKQKSDLLIVYFMLWTFVGPLIHCLLPAGGPIFYERLTGSAFQAASAPETARVADVLWTYYSTSSFGPGAGISAMPSLHIATTVWFCAALAPTSFKWPAIVASMLIFLLSMSLGWHYFVDGLVGGGAALILLMLLRGRHAALAAGSIELHVPTPTLST